MNKKAFGIRRFNQLFSICFLIFLISLPYRERVPRFAEAYPKWAHSAGRVGKHIEGNALKD
jgi:hypothetical protein